MIAKAIAAILKTARISVVRGTSSPASIRYPQDITPPIAEVEKSLLFKYRLPAPRTFHGFIPKDIKSNPDHLISELKSKGIVDGKCVAWVNQGIQPGTFTIATTDEELIRALESHIKQSEVDNTRKPKVKP